MDAFQTELNTLDDQIVEIQIDWNIHAFLKNAIESVIKNAKTTDWQEGICWRHTVSKTVEVIEALESAK
jgi:post-segregation antitoxin (ccd killing protein)